MNAGTMATKPYKVEIENVFIEVLDDNLLPTERADDGRIFCSDWTWRSKQIRLLVSIGSETNLFGFNVDGDKNITPLKNYSAKDKVYRKKVPIYRGKDTHYTPFTMYRENHIRLLELGDVGRFAVYEIAVVFQNGLGFLTTQRIYEERCYRGDGFFLSCPKFNEKWHQLIAFIGLTSEKLSYRYLFPDIGECIPDTSSVSAENLEDNVGVVDWFNVARGHGVMITNDGSAFFGYQDVSSSSRLVCPSKGEEVLFEKLISNPNKESSIPLKAIGVITS